jgi:multicomponent Na+:H+ antiporter subunit D
MISIPPAFILITGAIVLPFLPRRIRPAAFLLFPVLAFVYLLLLPHTPAFNLQFLNFSLVLLRVDGLSLCFAYIFVIITFLGGVYAFHVKDRAEQACTLLYAGCALGVVFAGDLITLLIFWEIMAFSSVYLIWARGTPLSRGAGMRYLIIHIFGGSVLLAGILIYINQSGTIVFDRLDGSLGTCLILFSFCLNAAVPPLHAWLSDAYPEGTVTGSVFLSAFTTKTAVYVLARGFAGWELLAWAGAVMAVYGVIYAVLQNDIRRILAYHIISQVGYMVCGVGIGTALAVDGATAHAFTHILYKALLFMGAGSVLYMTGYSKLTDLGGLFKKMPAVFALFMVGAFSISGLPLFSGFVSKSIIIFSAETNHLTAIYLLLNIASVGTFLSIALKLAYFTWFGEERRIQPLAAPPGMYIGMGLTALTCIVIGVYPQVLYNILPYPIDYQPYTYAHIVNTCLLFVFTGLCFWWLKGKLAGKNIIILDLDWFYRRPAGLAYRIFVLGTSYIFGFAGACLTQLVIISKRFALNPLGLLMDSPMMGKKADIKDKDASKRHDSYADRYRLPSAIMIFLLLLIFILMLAAGIFHLR